MDTFKALSPWAEVDYSSVCALTPRLDTIDGKTIGLFSHFKGHSPIIAKEIAAVIAKDHPTTKFEFFQYPKDLTKIDTDAEWRPKMEAFLKKCDGVIGLYGDAGTCSMYCGVNNAFVEKCGVPDVLLVQDSLVQNAKAGCSANMVPNLRMVIGTMPDFSRTEVLDQAIIDRDIKPDVARVTPELIDGLLRPLTEEEKKLPVKDGNKYASMVTEGTYDEIQKAFYRRGWSLGYPIIPPTRERVDEMLRGTDLPKDYVVAELPPMYGKATVEKIAINGVMAGCLPIHMPVLIALVRAMMHPAVHLVGWTCSIASFAPTILLSGKIRNELGLNCAGNAMSQFYKPQNAISQAYALIVYNISGARPTVEITAGTGHEEITGVVIGEDEERVDWKPFHTEYGLEEEDSAVSVFWGQGRAACRPYGNRIGDLLAAMCDCTDDIGYDPGVTFYLTPSWAKVFTQAGYSRKDIRWYISEYARKSAKDTKIRWMMENNHAPRRGFILPLDPTRSARKYNDYDHIQVVVVGGEGALRCVAKFGGGDHGGPGVAKIEYPKNWDKLLEEYSDYTKLPDFIRY